MMKRLLVVAALLLLPVAAYAEVNFSMAEANLGAEYGAKFEVAQDGGQRLATGLSADNRQAVRFWGPTDEYARAQAMVDLRPANHAKGRAFLVSVARWMVPDSEWGNAERFIDASLKGLKTGEKAKQKAGGKVIEFERSSDVQAVLKISGGAR